MSEIRFAIAEDLDYPSVVWCETRAATDVSPQV